MLTSVPVVINIILYSFHFLLPNAMLQYLYFVIYMIFFSIGQIPGSRIARSRDIHILNFDRFLLGVLQKGYSNFHSQEHGRRQ